MKLFVPPCRNTEICPPWKSCLECEWRVCVSSTDALVLFLICCNKRPRALVVGRYTKFLRFDLIWTLTPCNVALSRHWFHQVTAPCNVACASAIVTVNSPSGSTLQCDTWLWDDMPLNSPKRPPYWNWNSTSGFHFHASPQSTSHSVPVCEILSKPDHPRQKKRRDVDFQGGGSQRSWIVGIQ